MESELSFDGITIERILERDAQRVVATILDSLVSEVELYRTLPRDVIDVDVRQVIYENLNGFRDVVRRRGAPSADMIATATASAYRRAEEGIDLEAVIAAYLTAAHEAWRFATVSVTSDDVADLREVTDLMIGFMRGILTAVARAYMEELRSSHTQDLSMQTNLLGALLAGEPADEAAMLAGVELPPTYTVVSVDVPTAGEPDQPAEQGGSFEASVSRRRRARQLRAAVHSLYGDSALVSLDHRGGVVLIPRDVPDTGSPTSLTALAAALSTAATAPALLTADSATPAGVAAAARHTRELVAVARRSGRPGQLFRLHDLLLEFHLGQPSAASPHLAALLAPLAANPDLIPTLRVHLANGLDRRVSAQTLNVHANTVDYRIQRVRVLTGLDPSVPAQSAVLLAALAALPVVAG